MIILLDCWTSQQINNSNGGHSMIYEVVDVKKIIILCSVVFLILIGITILICCLLNRNKKSKIKFVNKKFTEDKDDERN